MHLCPVCGLALEERTAVGRRFMGCRSCAGLWLAENVLADMLVAMREGSTLTFLDDVLDRPRERPCPACPRSMRSERLEDLPVDRCPDHGVWFDRHELEDALYKAATSQNLAEELGKLR